MTAGTLVVRQRTLVECMKKRRVVIPETDSDEEEGGSVCDYRRYEREQL
jgi:hypothetical protein